MADISRYRGGASRKVKPRGTKQNIAAPRYEDTVVSERRETARSNNSRYQPEQNGNDRDVFDLRTGSFSEELPINRPRERDRSLPRPRASIGGTDVELDGDKVRVTRRFKAGGEIKAPQGDSVEFSSNGRKRRVSASEVASSIKRRPK